MYNNNSWVALYNWLHCITLSPSLFLFFCSESLLNIPFLLVTVLFVHEAPLNHWVVLYKCFITITIMEIIRIKRKSYPAKNSFDQINNDLQRLDQSGTVCTLPASSLGVLLWWGRETFCRTSPTSALPAPQLWEPESKHVFNCMVLYSFIPTVLKVSKAIDLITC